MTPANVDEFFRRLQKERPKPQIELNYTNAYTLLVATVLAAQSTDKGVNKATEPLFKIADTPQKMLKLGEEKLKDYIKSTGFFNAKAKSVMALSRDLVEKFGGEVPQTREELVTLAGVGPKTANVILNTIFHQPVIAVDTHVFRVANRTGLAHADTPEKIEEKLMRVVPDKWLMNAHHWLVLHGRYTCIARKPKCPICPVRDLCAYKDKTVH